MLESLASCFSCLAGCREGTYPSPWLGRCRNRDRVGRFLQPLERQKTIHFGFRQPDTDDADAYVSRHRINLIQRHLGDAVQSGSG